MDRRLISATLRDRLASARMPIIVVGVALLSGYAVWQFAAVARDRRRRRQA